MRDTRKRVVRDGYDQVAATYAAWQQEVRGDPRGRFLREATAALHVGASILDLGCGAGVPSIAEVAGSFHVTGVDISTEQIRRARANLPRGRFLVGDLTEIAFRPGSFDAVTAFYSISHVPREQHAALFGKVAAWLRPGGLFLASLSAGDSPDWTGDWLGVRMFFSGFGADTNRRLLQRAGFDLLVDEVLPVHEPEATVEFQWVIARIPR